MKFNSKNKFVLILFLVILTIFLIKINFVDLLLLKESFVYGGMMKDNLIKHSLICSGENQALLPICRNNYNLF
jgi:hypothetical protein